MVKKNTKLQRWGNSNAVRLPTEFVEQLGLKSSDELVLAIEGDVIVMYKPSKSLEMMIDEMGDQEFSEEIDTGEPVGKEKQDV